MRLAAAFFVLTMTTLASAAEPPKTPKPASPAATEDAAPKGRRTVTIGTGAGVPQIAVAKGRTTTLMFDTPIKAVDLLDAAKIFAPPPSTPASKSLYLTTLRDPGSVVTTLMVVLSNGKELPFQLVGVKDAKDADVVVDVATAVASTPAGPPPASGQVLTAGPSEDEAAACRVSVGQLRDALDQCQANTGSDALRKIAQIILSEDATASADSVVFEGKRGLRAVDKQNSLLVEATGVYRFFGNTYLVMAVENRVADRTWILDRASVRLTGAGADLPVIASVTEFPTLKPSEQEKVIVVFATPTKRAKSSVAVSLFEKSGNRNVTLDIDL